MAPGGLDLKYFIRRSKVLQQYRHLLRAARHMEKLGDPRGKDATEQIKISFRTYQHDVDKWTVAVLLKDGDKKLDLIKSLTTGAPLQSEAEGPGWKGTTDADGADERGRVGNQWPWERA
mmetsp:Transcript_14943/g.26675  ORF Transcript_14943/g.26675 Transcript_14943/m.26675 type:complete len:119 (-) Transcript_14943:79-435(-)